jgi:hypothetical protein
MLFVSRVLLFINAAALVFADVGDRKIIVTSNAAMELPGKALPAGTYVFKVLDSNGGRNIVQVFDKDEKQLLATVLAIPDYRMDPPDKPIIKFDERAANAPEAVKAIYFPGDTTGLQLVYPQYRATELAKQTHQNVLSMPNDMSRNMRTTSTSAGDSGIRQIEQADVTGVNPQGKTVDLTSVVGSKP